MKKSVLFLSALAALAASCSRDAVPVPGAPDGEIRFTAAMPGMSVLTRTAAVTSMDTVNVLCYTGTPGSAETQVFNSVFRSDGAAQPTYTASKFWPAQDASYRFYASNLPVVHSAAGSYVVATNAYDVLVASLEEPVFKASNTLVFSHAFARLGTMTVTASDGYEISGLTITLVPLVSGNLKLSNLTWSSTSEGAAVTLATEPGLNAATDVYLVPGTYTMKASYTLTKGSYSQTYTDRSGSVTLQAGYMSNFSTDLAKTGAAVGLSFSVEVEAWKDKSHEVNF